MSTECTMGSVSGATSTEKTLKSITAKDIPGVRERLLKKQKGICPICLRTIADPVLDHDHKTGAVRDTLCRNCNRFEGKVLQWANTVPYDNIELLVRLARYWRRHQENKHSLLHPNKITKRRRRAKVPRMQRRKSKSSSLGD